MRSRAARTFGAGPQDEDQVLVNAQNFDQVPYDFFGLGQQGPGPFQNQAQDPPEHGQQGQQPPAMQQALDQASDWNNWPDELPTIRQQLEGAMNIQQPAPLPDLNEEPDMEDPVEVIIHPPLAAAPIQDQELDQDLINVEVEQRIALPDPPEPVIVPVQAPVENLELVMPQGFPNDLLMEDADVELMGDEELQGQDPHLLGLPVDQDLQIGRMQLFEDNSIQQQFVLQNPKLALGDMPVQQMKAAITIEVPKAWSNFLSPSFRAHLTFPRPRDFCKRA